MHKFKFRRPNWRNEEIDIFLKSWREHAYLNRFFKKGCNRTPLYFAIVKDLQKEGFSRSMSEITIKMRTMTRLFRRTEHGGSSDYRWFNEIKEILQIEKDARKDRRYVAAPRQMDPSLELLYRPYIEANVTELDEVVTAPDFNDDSNSIPDYKYYTATKHVEPEGTNTRHLSIPDLSTIDSQKITENVLLSCLEEFQKSNRELEANDIAILRQFKEQNDIFRAHTALLRKLLKD